MSGVDSSDMLGYANTERCANGKTRAVCEYCGSRSKAVECEDGDIPISKLSRGWWCAPYPPSFRHKDGTYGDRFTCKKCDEKMSKGSQLKSRSYKPNAKVTHADENK